tara:strand:- start:1708 stop:2292 length:585 start_codon:yes stop_codon:yes gene_type:complete
MEGVMSLQEEFDVITKDQCFTDEMGKSCTAFEYYFTLSMQSEFHDVSFEESEIFLQNFVNLIEHEELQEQGLRFLCNELWMSSRYFNEFRDEFIGIFGNFLTHMRETGKFTLSLVFGSLSYKWGRSGDSTNDMINDLLNKDKVNTDNDDWYMEMDEDIYGSLNAFVELKDYIIIDIDNYYSQIFNGKCNHTIDY